MIWFADLEAYGKKYYDIHNEVKAYALLAKNQEGYEIAEVDTYRWLLQLIDTIKAEAKHNDEYKENKVFFHNLGGYDGHFLLPYLIEYEKTAKNIKFSYMIEGNKRILSLDLKMQIKFKHSNGKREKKTIFIRFRDTARLWPATLAQLGMAVGMPKLEIEEYDILDEFSTIEDYKQYNNGKDWEYLQRDVDVLLKYYEETKDFLDIEGSKITSGSQAVQELIKTNQSFDKSKYWIYDLRSWNIVNSAYYGGFTWQRPETALKQLRNVHGLDITSSYPHVLRNYSMPYGHPIKDENDPRITLKYFKCKAKSAIAKSIPFYPFYACKEMMDSIDDKDQYKIENYDVEWNCNNYMLDFLMKWYDFEDLEIEFQIGFKERYGMFIDFFDKFFAFKDHYGKTGEKAKYNMSKVFINNIYGKMVQNPERKGTQILNKKDLHSSELYNKINDIEYHDGYKVENFMDDYYFTTKWNTAKTFIDKNTGEERVEAAFAPIGEKTTAIARIRLLENIMDDKPRIMTINGEKRKIRIIMEYSDSDSNYVRIQGLTDKENYDTELVWKILVEWGYWMDNEALGAWTYDGCSEVFIGRRAKHYLKLNTHSNGKVKDYDLKGGGFNVSAFNAGGANEFEITPKMYQRAELEVQNGKLNSNRVKGGVLLEGTSYKFTMPASWHKKFKNKRIKILKVRRI